MCVFHVFSSESTPECATLKWLKKHCVCLHIQYTDIKGLQISLPLSLTQVVAQNSWVVICLLCMSLKPFSAHTVASTLYECMTLCTASGCSLVLSMLCDYIDITYSWPYCLTHLRLHTVWVGLIYMSLCHVFVKVPLMRIQPLCVYYCMCDICVVVKYWMWKQTAGLYQSVRSVINISPTLFEHHCVCLFYHHTLRRNIIFI